MEAVDWLIIIHPYPRAEPYSRKVYRTQDVTVLVGYVVMVAQQEGCDGQSEPGTHIRDDPFITASKSVSLL